MKKVFLLAIVLGLVGCSGGEKAEESVEKSKVCEVVDDLAKSIMTSRQAGTPMVENMRIADNNEDEQARALIKAIVSDAYAEPRYNTEENQDKAVTDFRNKMYHGCMSRVRG